MVKTVSLSRRGLAGGKSRALTFHLLFPKLEEEEKEEEGEEKEQEEEEEEEESEEEDSDAALRSCNPKTVRAAFGGGGGTASSDCEAGC